MSKRDREDSSPPLGPPAPKVAKKKDICILHTTGIKHGAFTAFAGLKDSEERFQKLKEIRDRRIGEYNPALRMEDICRKIPQMLQQNHGYHRGCYQKFTKNLDRLTQQEDIPSPSGSQCRSTRSSAAQKPESTIFNPDCIFCNKEGKIHITQGGSRTTQGTSSFERDGWQRIVTIAQGNQHHWLLRRIEGYDLFACEAKYHNKCRKQYIKDPDYWKS